MARRKKSDLPRTVLSCVAGLRSALLPQHGIVETLLNELEKAALTEVKDAPVGDEKAKKTRKPRKATVPPERQDEPMTASA